MTTLQGASVPQLAATSLFTLVIHAGSDPEPFEDQLQHISSLTPGDLYDVVIVDHGSSDGVRSIFANLGGDVTIVPVDPSASFARAMEQGARAATGRYLVFIGANAPIYPGWLSFIVERLVEDASIHVIRSADSDITCVERSAFAAVGGFHPDVDGARAQEQLIISAAARGLTIRFDGRRSTGASSLRTRYLRDGFVHLEGFLDPKDCDAILEEVDAYYASQGVDPFDVGRVMNFHHVSTSAQQYLLGTRLDEVLRECFADDPLFLQTILFNQGSQQNLHSDWLFMSTDRAHRMCGTWLALEDVHDDAGPLEYAPGSHYLPIESIGERWIRMGQEIEARVARGEQPDDDENFGPATSSPRQMFFYHGWQASIRPMAEAAGFHTQRFLPKKGDLLVWHANLVHGGTPINDPSRTRKSIVAHYLTKSIGEYWDMSYPDTQHGLSAAAVEQNQLNGTPWLVKKRKRKT